MHQNVNVSHYDGEMTFLGTPKGPSVSHHSWRTCRPMEAKADMCNAGGTAVLTPSMLTAVARRIKVTEAEDKSPQGHSVRPPPSPSFLPSTFAAFTKWKWEWRTGGGRRRRMDK